MTLDGRRHGNRPGAEGQTLEPLRPAHGTGNAEQTADRFPHVMHLVQIEGIQEPFHVSEELLDRPHIVGSGVR